MPESLSAGREADRGENRVGLAGASAFRVVIISDDAAMAGPLASTLEREQYVTSWRPHSDEARATVRTDPPDLVVLDMDGHELYTLAELRHRHGETDRGGYRGPVLALSSHPDELYRVDVLDSGADDVVAKPFVLAELHARARALLRRARSPAVAGGELVVDRAGRRVFVNQRVVETTSREFEVLVILTDAAGAVVPRDQLMAQIWTSHVIPKTLDVTVARIRAKLRTAGARVHIAAVRGVGFRLQPLPESDPHPADHLGAPA